ncbi:hypothetical protein EDB83DRAFT_2313701 [Lactarius deliciosus]|nr:hypothetical protein EDB83DRAFT_2313701 [Lactarius deliciosus]
MQIQTPLEDGYDELLRLQKQFSVFVAIARQVDQFNRSRKGDERHKQWLNPTVNVLYAISEVLGEVIDLVWMANAQLLKVTHDADDKLTEVGDGVKGVKSEVRVVGEKVKVVDDKLQGIIDVRWQSPRIHPQITTSYGIITTKDQASGSSKASALRGMDGNFSDM